MAMSDDPRYRRGQSNNQRPPQGQDDMRGRGESRGERPARNYSGADTSEDRPAAPSGRTASFSAYRPEAYAASDKRPPRQEWEEPRSAAPRPQSPAAEAYPRTAPERPSAQQDTRDPYRDRSSVADPYAMPPQQREYEQDWRPGKYPESKSSFQDKPSYADTPSYQDTPAYQEPPSYQAKPPYQEKPAYQEKSYPAFYDETPPEPDVQDVHSRFFAQAEPEIPQARYRGNDYGAEAYPAPRDEPAYAPPQPQAQQRASFGAERDYNNTWDDSFELAPAPASLRPQPAPGVAAPAHGHDDDLDADFFADDDEFDNEDFHEEKKSGRTKLVAAVLVGAIITGGGLAYLYKTSANRGGGGDGMPFVEASTEPYKETRNDSGGRKFPATKPIQSRLGEGGDTEGGGGGSAVLAASSTDAESAGAVTTTGGGSLEERINKALRDAKGSDGQGTTAAAPDAGAGSSEGGANASPDAPQAVKTVKVNPDGSIGGDSDTLGTQGRRVRTASAATEPVVTTAANTEAAPPATATRSIAGTRVAAVAPAPQPEPAQEAVESPGGTGQFFVQIGARNDQAQALAAFNGMQQKYSSVLGNYSPSIRKADLGDKGIWYRLRVGPFQDKGGADKLCDDLKAAGWKQCFSVKD